ncbi:MAG: DUF115 domain-containing protein [Ignavibacteria bacterium]|nr:DUF115 domain-containing protein [Ignavibacteria bacterium]
MTNLFRLPGSKLKELSLKRIRNAIIRRILSIPHTIAWYLPISVSKTNKKKISLFKNIHLGKRCFIVANGPSLNKTDLSLLENEYIIGMNRIYLLEHSKKFKPTYLVVADIDVQLNQFTQEYNDVQIPKFFPWEVRNNFSHTENTNFYKMKFSSKFNADFQNSIGAGKSVTIICIQLAYYMGFKEVILIGKDHSYTVDQKGVPGTRIKSSGTEDNHFIKGYYKEGMKWTIPNYAGEEYSYSLAREAFEKDGREILDATINGNLNVFKKINYYDLFNKEKQ